MIEYEYEDLFKQHDCCTILIVPQRATVESVSNDAPTISNADWYVNSDTDMLQESFELIESINSKQNLVIGALEGSQCKFTIYNVPEIPNLENEWCKIYLYFNDDSDTLFQVGVYKVVKDKYSADRGTRNIVCYDLIQTLIGYDITKWYYSFFDGSSGIPTIASSLNSLFSYLETETEAFNGTYLNWDGPSSLINKDYSFTQTIDSDSITFDFFMQKILELNGCFGRIDRTGKFIFKYMEWYDKPPVKVIDDELRIPVTQYSDKYTLGIGFVDVYDKNGVLLWHIGSTNFKHPNIYVIEDSFLFADKAPDDSDTIQAITKMHNAIWHLRYNPYECECIGDLCVEVGDRINIQYGEDEEENPLFIYSYVLERRCKGIQLFYDTYKAKGDRKQAPRETESTWHTDDKKEGVYGNAGVSEIKDDNIEDFYELIRNIGFRALDKPSNVLCEYDDENMVVKFLWTDPDDIANSKPVPVNWAGTMVLRKENDIFRNIWDGEPDITTIINETTRDTYSESYLTDNTIEENKKYYYAIFPYDTKGDYGKPVIVSVNTGKFLLAPTIESVEMGATGTWDGSEMVIAYSGDNNTLTVKVADSHIVFTLYVGSTSIYSWQSPVGSSIDDVNKIHVSFLKDDTNYFAKPSFIYETAEGVYSYNQESPTNVLMGSIYHWLTGKARKNAFDIVRTLSFTNYERASSTANIQSSWLNTDKNIYVDYNNTFNGISYSNGIISIYALEDGYYMMPLNKKYHITKIKYDMKLDAVLGSVDGAYEGGIRWLYCDSDKTLHWSGLDTFGAYQNSGAYGITIPDFNWHTYEIDVDADVNYLVPIMRRCNKINYKNIIIEYEE